MIIKETGKGDYGLLVTYYGGHKEIIWYANNNLRIKAENIMFSRIAKVATTETIKRSECNDQN